MARTKPYEFAQIILDEIPYIQSLQNSSKRVNKGNYIFQKNEICKIAIVKGKDAFLEAAEMMSLRECLPPLEYHEDLCMQISNDKDEWVNKTFLEKYLEEKSVYLNYKYFGFHFDLGVVDALTSVALQIIDDNSFHLQRRNNILNPNYKYIGITNKKIGNSFCVYLTFGS